MSLLTDKYQSRGPVTEGKSRRHSVKIIQHGIDSPRANHTSELNKWLRGKGSIVHHREV